MSLDWQRMDDPRQQIVNLYKRAQRVAESLEAPQREIEESGEYCFRGCNQRDEQDV
jgi:hypothetical protein